MLNSSTNKKRSPTSQDGFTLLEVLIAIVILTIGILGMMLLQTTAITTNHKASTLTKASTVAAMQVETLRNTPFGSISIGPPDPAPFTDPASGYTVTWTARNTAPVLPDAKLITVTVTRPQGMAPVVYNYTKFRNL